jgi:malonate decarboxylase epsilon subunit
LHRLPRHAEISRVLEEARTVQGHDLADLDTERALHSTVAVQLGILTAGVAAGRALRALAVEPSAVAGLSVGAFTAAVLCGALDFASALELVRARAELMQAAYPRSHGMGVIVGLTEGTVRQLVERASRPDAPVFLAGINAPTQLVIAGSDRGIEACFELARASGARGVERLSVSVPSHCLLLAEASRALAAHMAAVSVGAPLVPYITNVSARATTDPAVVRDDLSFNLMYPVRWHDSTSLLFERGVRLFIELPPGRVLTALAAAAFPEARAFAMDEHPVTEAAMLARLHQGA